MILPKNLLKGKKKCNCFTIPNFIITIVDFTELNQFVGAITK